MKTDQQVAGELLKRLFPLCRSITGDGVRQTLEILREYIPLSDVEIPSGTRCYDWQIPPEWNIRDAWIRDAKGREVVDFKWSNLHVLGYSVPIREKMGFNQLRPHLHTLPDRPDAIPYRTSYYKRDWGFCLSHRRLQAMDPDETYEVFIDSSLNSEGGLTLAHAEVKGRKEDSYFLSTYICHPSLANDNLSGVIVNALLLRRLSHKKLSNTYRFIFIPETIGAIAYLWKFEEAMRGMKGGYVLSTVGGPGDWGYKSSFVQGHPIDRAAVLALKGVPWVNYPFEPIGSDERQFSSPGFRIPVGTICKSKYYEYPEYHTSDDNLDFVSPEQLVCAAEIYERAVMILDANRSFMRIQPHGEIHLSRYNLYQPLGGVFQQPSLRGDNRKAVEAGLPSEMIKAFTWILFASDGKMSLMDVAEKSGICMEVLVQASERLLSEGIIKESQQ